MPATRSRISASSSTIRISPDMLLLVYRLLFFELGRFRLAGGGKLHPHPGAALPRDPVGGIAQLNAAAMILDNSSDDGETQPRALFARGDIRLEQPAAIFLRQADSVVDDIDDDILALARGKNVDQALAQLRCWHRGYCLGGVLDDVGERL